MDSVTVVFQRCNTERTVPWSTVVVFDADKVDQPWRPGNGLGVAEEWFWARSVGGFCGLQYSGRDKRLRHYQGRASYRFQVWADSRPKHTRES